MEGMSSCAIMVLNWNGASWLARCLPSVVEAAAEAGAEVWVVDNDSADDSRRVCEEQFPWVRFFDVGGNKVLAGYNVAAAACDSDIIVLLNNDLVVEKDFLPPLLAAFEDDPDLFAVAPCVRSFPPGRDAPVEMEGMSAVWERGLVRGVSHPGGGSSPTWFTIGGAMACRREMYLELGGFDELYFPTYHDDVDLSWRAWKRGWTCRYEAGSTVYHAGGSTMGRSEKVQIMMSRNELLFHWKNLSSPTLLAVHMLTGLPRLVLRAARGDRAGLVGFVEAAQRWRAVLRSRRQAQIHVRLSDAEVLRRFRRFQQARS